MYYEIPIDEPVYPISTAAKLLNISIHTLRMYEKENLIIPFKKSTNHRLYSKSDIERIRCIRNAINESKISINGIKTIYSMMPCWEYIGCSNEERANCPAYHSHSEPCWAAKGKGTVCEKKECRNCDVYNKFTDCSNIKTFIKNLTRVK